MNETWKTLIEVNGAKFVSLSEVGKVLLTRIFKQDKREAELQVRIAEVVEDRRLTLNKFAAMDAQERELVTFIADYVDTWKAHPKGECARPSLCLVCRGRRLLAERGEGR